MLQSLDAGSENGKQGQAIRENVKEELVNGLIGESLMGEGYRRWL